MIEAELKARVGDRDQILALLGARVTPEPATYADTYYDTPDSSLAAADRELRVRLAVRQGLTRCHLTYKEAAVPGTGAKPEHETRVDDPSILSTVFRVLGLVVLTQLTKHCHNYRFDAHGYRMLATVVSVPELAESFVEVETLVPAAGDVPAALAAIRLLLAELGLGEADLDTRAYTDMVRRARMGG
ncbi:MAG TPA: class IV adenylate cyclase [Mycobacteriales bacterium]|nr:class IV adenylate cyclase [Mycobacteriales bacterium]